MTQKEAIILALETLGGRARLKDIYTFTLRFANFKEGSDIAATIRAELQRHPESFRPSPDTPKGWWELVSFQEKIARKDARIAELETRVAELEAEPKEDAFVKKLVAQAKKIFKRKRDVVDELRTLLLKVDRPDAANELDYWLDETEKKSGMIINGPLNDIHDNDHVNAGI